MKYLLSHSMAKNIMLSLLLISFVGCTGVKLIADKDSKMYDETINAGKQVDSFYTKLLEKKSSKREYQKYSDQYLKIETELREIYTKNNSKSLNDESTKISKSILGLWLKYKAKHQLENQYSSGNAKLDKDRFVRLFASALNAESSK
ncbi:hypothetical protein MNBD_GAMMA22-1673 [hydrothermal vent metagenome]|uniref:Lipoprotein n=1 Tax=hydrothermal vent metagenome TaxID=652676 RepID=A0A3B0ZN74_9ZZZZ